MHNDTKIILEHPEEQRRFLRKLARTQIKKKIHIFLLGYGEFITLCNQKGSMLKALHEKELQEFINQYGDNNICKKCLKIYIEMKRNERILEHNQTFC